VKDAQANPVHGRTRWRRFAAVVAPAAVAAGAIVFGMANGAIAASFAVSGTSFKVSAGELDGDGFAQYGGIAHANVKDAMGIQDHPVAVAGIPSARITDMCQSVVVPGTSISLVLRAGQDGKVVTATDLMFDLTELASDATFTTINIGQDASTLEAGGAAAHGQVGGFGQQASHINMKNVKQIAWSASAGTFKLDGLKMKVSLSGEQCFPEDHVA
jgi:Family of unknown function (DUF6230)